ncbi:hypothetical protein DPEC_G00121850 [Dallia pectoralis]|uniref:Uncharacterized protein n=1 Tax=Dallia pectoralis TaxID=75939 RepID=A0ACC2GQL3_DALPE|nr:hypothetical protein DPEC_G00121850 [Dallia pectoralis]
MLRVVELRSWVTRFQNHSEELWVIFLSHSRRVAARGSRGERRNVRHSTGYGSLASHSGSVTRLRRWDGGGCLATLWLQLLVAPGYPRGHQLKQSSSVESMAWPGRSQANTAGRGNARAQEHRAYARISAVKSVLGEALFS